MARNRLALTVSFLLVLLAGGALVSRLDHDLWGGMPPPAELEGEPEHMPAINASSVGEVTPQDSALDHPSDVSENGVGDAQVTWAQGSRELASVAVLGNPGIRLPQFLSLAMTSIVDIMEAQGEGVDLDSESEWSITDVSGPDEMPIFRTSGSTRRLYIADRSRFPELFEAVNRNSKLDPVSNDHLSPKEQAYFQVTEAEKIWALLLARRADTLNP